MPAKDQAASAAKANDSGIDENQAITRLLLALWDMGGAKTPVKKGKLAERIKRKTEKSEPYQKVFEQLEKSGAIAITTKNRVVSVSLTDKGIEVLGSGLKSPDFQYDAGVGAKTANALLKWIREMETQSNGAFPATKGKRSENAIASYEHFKSQVLPLFEKLNKTENYSGLVPIWHLRRELGNRVEREEFNNWLMEMQAEHLFYLQSGEARGATEDQKRDSITDEVRGLLFFASQPS
jgi:DNA-binding PadR family transcriptional regulator